LLVQALHQRHRCLADADARLDHVAQFQQADAEAVGAGVGPLDETGSGHRRQDAVRGRRV
jgi:putative component of toxin-antitoxin plasmid stabilization module